MAYTTSYTTEVRINVENMWRRIQEYRGFPRSCATGKPWMVRLLIILLLIMWPGLDLSAVGKPGCLWSEWCFPPRQCPPPPGYNFTAISLLFHLPHNKTPSGLYWNTASLATCLSSSLEEDTAALIQIYTEFWMLQTAAILLAALQRYQFCREYTLRLLGINFSDFDIFWSSVSCVELYQFTVLNEVLLGVNIITD